MKKLLIAGTTALLAGLVVFALARDDREPETADAPVVEAPEPEVEPVELADPGTIEPDPVAQVEELPEGWEVDDKGHVWEPLSFHKPQVRNNGDGTLTMRKLVRIYEADGSMREVPITATAAPVQKRLPVQVRGKPAYLQEAEDAEKDQEELSKDGE